MRSIIFISLVFAGQVHGEDKLLNKLAGRPAARVRDFTGEEYSAHHADLDSTVLGKTRGLSTPSRANVSPAHTYGTHRKCFSGYAPSPGHSPSVWTGNGPAFREKATHDQNMRVSRSRVASAVVTDGPVTANKLHVHFGAGRLAFGLVLQTLVNGNEPFIIVNEPVWVWADFEGTEEEKVNVFVNGVDVLPDGLQVITAKSVEGPDGILGAVQRGIQAGTKGFLLFDVNPDHVKSLMESASSYSCALGPRIENLVPMLKMLPDTYDEKRPKVYACENDHSSVEKMQLVLRNKVDFVPCMVDRICSDMQVSPADKTIKVTAEDHVGSIVMLKPMIYTGKTDEGKVVPMAGEGVTVPTKEAHAQYLYRKKLLTVNSMHTVIAFISLIEYAIKQGPDFQIPETPLDIPLISKATLSDARREEIWAWAVAQLLVLMWEHGIPTMLQVHKVDSEAELVKILLEHLRTTLERFYTVEDSTKRVLGGGVSVRYEGRLVPTSETVSSDVFTEGWGTAQSELLKQAELDYETLKTTLTKLVRDARPFAAVDKRVRMEDAFKKASAQEREALEQVPWKSSA